MIQMRTDPDSALLWSYSLCGMFKPCGMLLPGYLCWGGAATPGTAAWEKGVRARRSALLSEAVEKSYTNAIYRGFPISTV